MSEAYHSQFNVKDQKSVFGLAILPIRTKVSGPASSTDSDDIIDEALRSFRQNIFFKNYEIKGAADVTLIYLTCFITHCLKLITKDMTFSDVKKKLLEQAKEQTARPNNSHFLGVLIKQQNNAHDADLLGQFLKQAREELVNRLIELFYIGDERKFEMKFWLGLSKINFMNFKYSNK